MALCKEVLITSVHAPKQSVHDLENRKLTYHLRGDDYTGENHEPIAIGGGTYARALKCGVAFGPEIEGEEVTIHQINEYITIDRVKLMLEIYSEAVRQLTK